MHGVRRTEQKGSEMSNTIEIKREGFERLMRECSDAWYALYDYRERYGWGSEIEDKQLTETIALHNAIEYITGQEWYYDSTKERVVPVEQ